MFPALAFEVVLGILMPMSMWTAASGQTPNSILGPLDMLDTHCGTLTPMSSMKMTSTPTPNSIQVLPSPLCL